MLEITVPARMQTEAWDEVNMKFINIPGAPEVTLSLEHSLISLAKWESKWCKPFLSTQEKTFEETVDYIKCMTLNKNVDDEVYNRLSQENVKQINKYIEAPMTATTFSKEQGGRNNREVVTAEIIYYWMIALTIPIDICEKWHLNRLLTLIRVCNIKNQPPKKRSKRDILNQNAALNAARRKQYNTNG